MVSIDISVIYNNRYIMIHHDISISYIQWGQHGLTFAKHSQKKCVSLGCSTLKSRILTLLWTWDDETPTNSSNL